jgi:hypothetical protein
MLGILSGAMMIATRMEPVVTGPVRPGRRWQWLRSALLAAWR